MTPGGGGAENSSRAGLLGGLKANSSLKGGGGSALGSKLG